MHSHCSCTNSLQCCLDLRLARLLFGSFQVLISLERERKYSGEPFHYLFIRLTVGMNGKSKNTAFFKIVGLKMQVREFQIGLRQFVASRMGYNSYIIFFLLSSEKVISKLTFLFPRIAKLPPQGMLVYNHG